MNTNIVEEKILTDLLEACKQAFHFRILDITPVKRGWLNLKWIITTDSGKFLLKQYNQDRLKKYNEEELSNVFAQQNRLHQEGFPCPKVYSYNDQLFLKSEQGERFILMDFCEGSLVMPGKISLEQMYHLGTVTGRMHRLLNDGTLKKKSSPEFIVPSTEDRLSYWKKLSDVARENYNTSLLYEIKKQYEATQFIDLQDLDLHTTGWAHRDFWVDNLLFTNDHVSAVLDFDRMKYDYPQLDVARVIMSGALHNHELDTSLAFSFLEGYRTQQNVSDMYLTNALLLLWYMESTWWIHPKIEFKSGPPKRFVDEMKWLAENVSRLQDLLNGK
ncbi:phosphotransferase [Ornithinibacillus salinisoli]|uniref:Phosphotransferase n=1 Tax=Ornithinibacillus salinisoli TaxID=1848459 RepID=A0ABW4W1Z3_9BACI